MRVVRRKQADHMILINTFGIQDSGGITVLDKVLKECSLDKSNNYLILKTSLLFAISIKIQVTLFLRFLRLKIYYIGYILKMLLLEFYRISTILNSYISFQGQHNFFQRHHSLLSFTTFHFSVRVWTKSFLFKKSILTG